MTNINVADFFCGAGGFSEGFYQTGFNVVYALDFWKPACETHDINHTNCKTLHKNILDIKDLDSVPDTEIIVGSPPCISFSNSNKAGKADKTLGIKLIEKYLQIVLYKKTKPSSKLKYWILENVPNSMKFIKEKYTARELGLDEALPDLEIPKRYILTASDYGSPQGRQRAILGDYILPKQTNNIVFTDVILKALRKDIITDPSFPNIVLPKDDVSDHNYDSELPKDWTDKAKRLKTDHGYMGKMSFPDRTDRLTRTIMATESYCSRESIIFAKEDTENKYRAPTIRELACLMGFPIDYVFTGTSSTIKHKQIGNAVCVHLSMALANAIKEKMGIKLEKNPRELKQPNFNLNNLTQPLFAKHISKPKRLNSKFHIHVPNMKIKQLRVELDNINSDFVKENFIWNSVIHKGSGKSIGSVGKTHLSHISVVCLKSFCFICPIFW